MLDFLYTAVSWVLLTWHKVFNALGLDPSGGLNWSLSIVSRVMRICARRCRSSMCSRSTFSASS